MLVNLPGVQDVMAGRGDWVETARDVFVVEDDPAVLHSLEFALELEGYTVSGYRNATEALAEPTFPQNGCLVIDYNLPEMNGLDMLQQLRARGTLTPAILITGARSEAVTKRAAAADIPIVDKPLLGNALSQTIDAVFESRRH
jgi:FixJ family two-component response regulator